MQWIQCIIYQRTKDDGTYAELELNAPNILQEVKRQQFRPVPSRNKIK